MAETSGAAVRIPPSCSKCDQPVRVVIVRDRVVIYVCGDCHIQGGSYPFDPEIDQPHAVRRFRA
jgi:hypothetical protein